MGLEVERRAVRSVEEQQARVTAAAVAPRPVRVPIAEAQGLMCAEEVVTEHPMPGFDQAAIDGYAVRSVDVSTAGEAEIVLPVTGVIEAGTRTPSRLQPKAVRSYPDRRADAHAGRRRAAAEVDRRGASPGCGFCAGCGPGPT